METLLQKEASRATKSEARQVASLLLEVVPLAMRELRKELRLRSDMDLTFAQFRILAHLSCEPANNKTLADALGVSVPASSRMVKLLVQRKFAESTQALGDKREVLVKPTELGEKRVEEVREAVRRGLSERLEGFAASRLRQADAGLGLIKEILSELHQPSERYRN